MLKRPTGNSELLLCMIWLDTIKGHMLQVSSLLTLDEWKNSFYFWLLKFAQNSFAFAYLYWIQPDLETIYLLSNRTGADTKLVAYQTSGTRFESCQCVHSLSVEVNHKRGNSLKKNPPISKPTFNYCGYLYIA